MNEAITQKQSLDAVRRETDLILQATGDGIYGLDSDGKTIFANPAACRLTGFSEEEMLGKNQHKLSHHSHSDGSNYDVHECPIYLAFKDGKIRRESGEVFWRKDGTCFPVEYVSTPIWDDEELIGAVVSFRDISERVALAAELVESKERERLLQSDLHHVARVSAMGEVASAMAHELNQPLTAVMNYVQASRRLLDANTETAKEKVLGYMDKAIVQAGRAGDIIRGLRKFVEKEDTERTFENINEIINEAIALVLPGGRSSTLKLTTKLSPELSDILVHKVRLQQVVVNLVRNALEALEGRDAPHIEVSTRLYRDSAIEVCICDNGPGLPDEVSQKLFQSFVTTKQNGMGVGLSICKTIVEEHGGEINAVSNEQGGVSFCFTLPTTTPTQMESGNV